MRNIAISAFVAVAAFLGVQYWISRPGDLEACSTSQAGAAIGGPFELVNTAGQTVTDTDVITEPTLVYFGYTFCPDVCPLDVSRNLDAIDLLAEKGVSATPVFITIDPARDTTEVLGVYASNMHEKLIALTGTDAQIAAASKAYKTYYKRNGNDPEDYLVDHSTFTYLVLPEHGFVEFFKRDTTPEEMAERVTCFANNA